MELFRIQGCVAVSPYWAFLSPCQYLPSLTTDCKSDSHKNRQNNPFLTLFNEEKQTTTTQLISTVIHVFVFFLSMKFSSYRSGTKADVEGDRRRWLMESETVKWRGREMESGAYPQAVAVWRCYPAGGNVWTSASGRPGMTTHTWRRPREKGIREQVGRDRDMHTQVDTDSHTDTKVEQKRHWGPTDGHRFPSQCPPEAAHSH